MIEKSNLSDYEKYEILSQAYFAVGRFGFEKSKEFLTEKIMAADGASWSIDSGGKNENGTPWIVGSRELAVSSIGILGENAAKEYLETLRRYQPERNPDSFEMTVMVSLAIMPESKRFHEARLQTYRQARPDARPEARDAPSGLGDAETPPSSAAQQNSAAADVHSQPKKTSDRDGSEVASTTVFAAAVAVGVVLLILLMWHFHHRRW